MGKRDEVKNKNNQRSRLGTRRTNSTKESSHEILGKKQKSKESSLSVHEEKIIIIYRNLL